MSTEVFDQRLRNLLGAEDRDEVISKIEELRKELFDQQQLTDKTARRCNRYARLIDKCRRSLKIANEAQLEVEDRLLEIEEFIHGKPERDDFRKPDELRESYDKLSEELKDFYEGAEFEDYAELLRDFTGSVLGSGFSEIRKPLENEIKRTLSEMAEIKKEQEQEK